MGAVLVLKINPPFIVLLVVVLVLAIAAALNVPVPAPALSHLKHG